MKNRSLFDVDAWVAKDFKPKAPPAKPVVQLPKVDKVAERPPALSTLVRENTGPTIASSVVGHVIRIVAEIGKVQASDIIGPSKERTLTHYRQFVMWLARRFSGRSLLKIGADLGGRHYTTILYGVRKTEHFIRQHRITVSKETAEDWAYALVSRFRSQRAKRDAEIHGQKMVRQLEWYHRHADTLNKARSVRRERKPGA